MIENLRKFLCLYGPSGYENVVRKYIKKELSRIKSDNFKIREDRLGNLFVSLKRKENKISFISSIDEWGLVITYREKKGYWRFAPLSDVEPYYLLGQIVRFSDGTTGLIQSDTDKKNDLKLNNLFIDTFGKELQIGDVGALNPVFSVKKNKVLSNNLTSRLGAFALLQVVMRNRFNGVNFIFSSQKKIGLRGAYLAAQNINSDVILVIDTGDTSDYLGSKHGNLDLGKGVGIRVFDRGVVVNRSLIEKIVKLAERKKIPYQWDTGSDYLTEGYVFETAGKSFKVAVLSIPVRFSRTNCQIADIGDLQSCIDILYNIGTLYEK